MMVKSKGKGKEIFMSVIPRRSQGRSKRGAAGTRDSREITGVKGEVTGKTEGKRIIKF